MKGAGPPHDKESPRRGAYVLLGGYGGVNVGDEEILGELVRQLKGDRQPGETKIYLLARRPPLEAARERYAKSGLIVLRLDTAQGIAMSVAALFRANLIIGGGEVLQLHMPMLLAFYVASASVNRLAGRRPCVIGAGAYGRPKILSRLLVRVLALLTRVIACRDVGSISLLREAGVPVRRIALAADCVFSSTTYLRTTRRSSSGARSGTIVVAQHSPTRKEIGVDELANLLRIVCEQFPSEPVDVLAHDIRDGFDSALIESAVCKLSHNQDVRVGVWADLDELRDLYSVRKRVVSARMHPLVLGAIFGCEMAALEVSSKVRLLAHELQIPLLAVSRQSYDLRFASVSELTLRRLEFSAARNYEVIAGSLARN